MAKSAVTTITNTNPFGLYWRPTEPESATLSRRDIHTILVKRMGWEPVDVQSFWLICAKLAKRDMPRTLNPRPFLVKAKHGMFRVEKAFSARDALAVVCEAEKCPRHAIEWVKPIRVSSEGHPRPAMRGGAAVLPPLLPTQRKTRL